MRTKLIAFFFVIVGLLLGIEIVGRNTKKIVCEKENNIEKFKMYYAVLNQWLLLKQQESKISSYFENAKYKVIAIYGAGEMGKRLYDELEGSNIHIKYIIDKKHNQSYKNNRVINLNELKKIENYKNIDAVIVTKMYIYDEIKSKLLEQWDCPIVSLEEILYGEIN